ncbi:MAG: hypothetical protein E7602_01310 [Ruminococcaceae bacterium]|nr:hypothetical protein [Oscillospiraceae bacterium]
MEKLLSILELKMKTPTNYSWFHLMFIVIVIGVTVFLCLKFKNCSDKAFRRIVLISWISMVVLEFYKQFVYSYSVEPSVIEWDYQWYAFPYQLCSTPLYVLPFIAFMKDSKFRDCFVAYMSTFSLFAGIAVFLYPNDVFISTIGINIQTMVHHGLQIVLGIFFIVYARKKFSKKYFAGGIIVFAALIILAMVLNLLVPLGIDETFNMFYISPYYDCTLPILSLIYPNVPYIVFLMLYALGFVLVAFIVYSIAKLILILTNPKRKKHAKN